MIRLIEPKKVIRLSASGISGSIIYGVRTNPFPNPFLEKAMLRGRIIHSRLGYTNSQMFSRYYKIGKDTVLITGMPDRVDGNYVYELKTYHSPAAKTKNTKVGTIQVMVYSFLTGLPNGKLVLYDSKNDKLTDEIDVPFNKSEFRAYIQKALKLKKLTLWYQNKYREVAKE